ncbi:MAG: hypothetical protein CMJ49_01615, partial [Planctomycetaceae bacterium]|nr:hypothetical protein [Planctomycetaceae bacterium]
MLNMNEPTDASLVSDALTGDAEAFCTLVRRYQDHAYGVALGVLADFDGALDAAQEAFLCAFCDLTKLKDPDRFGAWVCGIARNSAYEIRRDRQRQKSLAQRVAERRDVTEVAASVDAVAAKSEEHRRVRSALLRIHDKDREAMTLYYADGLSYAEISGTLSVSVGTLKGRLQRGRAAVR